MFSGSAKIQTKRKDSADAVSKGKEKGGDDTAAGDVDHNGDAAIRKTSNPRNSFADQGDNAPDMIRLSVLFKQNVPVETHKKKTKRYVNVFKGKEAVDWLVRTQGVSRQEAVRLGETLRGGELFEGVPKVDALFADDSSLYRFKEFEFDEQFAVPNEACKPVPPTVTGTLRKLRLTPDSVTPNPLAQQADAPADVPKYIIKPPADLTPLVVFINKKSGGQQGKELESQLEHLLSPYQVFDLSQGGPKPGLLQFKDVPNHIVLGCGGDGTIGWILSVMDKIEYEGNPPAVCILPLGTGNDISRVTGWGAGYRGQKVSDILAVIAQAAIRNVDRWFVKVTEYEDGEKKEKEHLMNNYMSLGFDASIAYEFHTARNANPGRFASRNVNKLWYVKFGADSILAGAKSLESLLELTIDGKPVKVEGGALIIQNVPSYSAGADIWGTSVDEYSQQSMDDNKLEVVGIRSSLHMGRIQSKNATGIRLGQGSEITISFRANDPIACQVDGEPWLQAPCKITIGHHKKSPMLFRIEKSDESTQLADFDIDQLAARFAHPLLGLRPLVEGTKKQAFSGSAAVDYMMYALKTQDREIAAKVLKQLLEKGSFGHASTKVRPHFKDDETSYRHMDFDHSKHAGSLPGLSLPFMALVNIRVLEGRDLPVKKAMRVIISDEHQSYTTPPAVDSKHPVWGQDYNFVIASSAVVLRAHIRKVGSVWIPFAALVASPEREGWYEVLQPGHKRAGELRIRTSVTYFRGSTDGGYYQGPLPFHNYAHKTQKTKVQRVGHGIVKTVQDKPAINVQFGKTALSLLRSANHRCCANAQNLFSVSTPEKPAEYPPIITAKFEYGYHDKKRQEVEVYVQDTSVSEEDWRLVTKVETDAEGQIEVPLPADLAAKAGYYRVRCYVPYDHSVAYGQLFVLAPGTELVVFDVDGTITVGDQEVVKQFFAESAGKGAEVDLQERAGSISMVRAWLAKGYLPIYLSGRQGSFYNLTRAWLTKHGFPPGPMHLTDTHMPTLPTYASVGNFKVRYLKHLQENLHLRIAAAYGNTKTDIKAYEEVGVPKSDTWIWGPFGGLEGTQAGGDDFVSHVGVILNRPDAAVAIPSFCLSW